MKKQFTTALFACLFLGNLFAQKPKPDTEGSLLDMLGDETETDHAVNAFKGNRVVNNHSIEMLAPGTLDFRILHRFGLFFEDVPGYTSKQNFNNFISSFAGLDQAYMRMSFDFGITKNFSAGIARSTSRKELDIYGKYRLLWQSKGEHVMPVSVVAVAGAMQKATPGSGFHSNLQSYFAEILIGRKFNESFSLQVAPIWLRQNEPESDVFPKNLYASSIGARYKITKRVAVVADYALAFNRKPKDNAQNPLAIGFDIETGGHVFQLHFSNAEGMNERAFLSDVNNDWWKGEIRFGFNLSRIFQIKKQKI